MICFLSLVVIFVKAACGDIASNDTIINHCPAWSTYNYSTQSCVCGSSLLGIVECHALNSSTVMVQLMSCHCMSRLNDTHENKGGILHYELVVLQCGWHGIDSRWEASFWTSIRMSTHWDLSTKGPCYCGSCPTRQWPFFFVSILKMVQIIDLCS